MNNSSVVQFAAVLTLLLTALLYGPFADSPIFFDDVYFFRDSKGYVTGLFSAGLFSHRWVTNATLALTYSFWGVDIVAYRVGNLLLHALAVFSLFLFVRELLAHQRVAEPEIPALGAALLFALHPVAAFAVGYLIERSIVLAGLFSVWMWIAVHRGVAGRRISWLSLSIVFYYLAVFSKEHAITALPLAVLVAWNAADGDGRKTRKSLSLPLPFWLLTAAAIVLRMKGIIGTAYEPLLGEMGAKDPQTAEFYFRSVSNQGWIFFKYILYWLAPVESWMAVDMREPFPPHGFAWPWVLGLTAFVGYGGLVALALWRGYVPRMVGIGLIGPWLLYLTMFGAVYHQESFVLYRSYLWALPVALPLALALAHQSRRRQFILFGLIGILCFGMTWARLQTFSHPLLVWDEAVNRLDGRDDLPGAYRIYYNRGLILANVGERQRALADFDKAVTLNPTFSFAYADRGAVFLMSEEYGRALSDFDRALDLKPNFARAYLGRGLVLGKMGRRDEALANLARACQLGYGCQTYGEEVAKAMTPGR